VQIPTILECLDLEFDWTSLTGELVWTLAQDALLRDDPECIAVRDCFRVVELITGFSIWDSVLRADGEG